MRHVFLTCLCACLIGAATVAQSACRQALALGLDVSGTVDAREYRLQLDGLAFALETAEVRAAFLSFPQEPVEILVYEWSGPDDQAVIIPWTSIKSQAELDTVVAALRGTQRREASPGTALGSAMQVGVANLRTRGDCSKHTLDISGDGKSNIGPRPQDIRETLRGNHLTINALAIGADAPAIGDLRQSEIGELSRYFQAYVILGEGAFVETAIGYQDYAQAMARKLLREIETLTLSALDPSDQ